MNVYGTAILLAALSVVCFAPRRWALIGVVSGVLYLTQGQGLVIGGVNVYAFRIIEVVACITLYARKELERDFKHELDKVFIVLFAYTVVVYMTRSREGLMYQIGLSVDAVLCYTCFRSYIKNTEELIWFAKTLSVVLLPYVFIVLNEARTGHNLFEALGGVSEIKYMRADRIRCYGSFRHPSLFGSVGATFLPIYISLLCIREHWKAGLLGVILALTIVYLSNSGGPLNAALVAILGWCCWPFRRRMHIFRRVLLALMIALALVMKAPIYYLPAKLGSLTGGGGYHRSYLIEESIKDFGKWWLRGIDIKETAHWFPYVLEETSGADMTNQFLSYGVRAGAGAVLLSLGVFVLAFRQIGRARLESARRVVEDHGSELIVWGLGAALTAHAANWFSISYWDQFYAVWYLHLAIISSVTKSLEHPQGEDS